MKIPQIIPFIIFINIFANAKFHQFARNRLGWHPFKQSSSSLSSSHSSSSSSSEFFGENSNGFSTKRTNATKIVEITFDCYPQVGNVLRSRPQQQNRTVKRMARIKLNLHCNRPKMTKLVADFKMECGSNQNRYFDYKIGFGQAKDNYKISKCAYSVEANCKEENEEMDISNLCGDNCPINPCDSIGENSSEEENVTESGEGWS